jgi:glycogen debranching enzyme
VLSADLLLQMADALGRLDEVADLRAERERLSHTINERLWNEETAFYHDELAEVRSPRSRPSGPTGHC